MMVMFGIPKNDTHTVDGGTNSYHIADRKYKSDSVFYNIQTGSNHETGSNQETGGNQETGSYVAE